MKLILTDRNIQDLDLTKYFPHILPDTFFTRLIRRCNELGLEDKRLIYIIHVRSKGDDRLIINLGYEDNILDIDSIEVFSVTEKEISNTDGFTIEWSSALTNGYIYDFLVECNKQGLKGLQLEDIFAIESPPIYSQKYIDFTLKGKSRVESKIPA